jgi:hypothetical protein
VKIKYPDFGPKSLLLGCFLDSRFHLLEVSVGQVLWTKGANQHRRAGMSDLSPESVDALRTAVDRLKQVSAFS